MTERYFAEGSVDGSMPFSSWIRVGEEEDPERKAQETFANAAQERGYPYEAEDFSVEVERE